MQADRVRRIGPAVLLPLLGLGLAVVVLSSAAVAHAGEPMFTYAPRHVFSQPKLYPLPRQAVVQCQLARKLGVRPARLPRATVALRPEDAPPRLVAERYRPGRNGSAVLVGTSFAYGAPWEPASGPNWRAHLWRNRPCCFLHFEIWRALAGKPTFPSTAQPASLGGHRGDLARATGYGLACGPGDAGVFFCNHTRFRWQANGVWFIASLHRFGSMGETQALLNRLIRQLRPT